MDLQLTLDQQFWDENKSVQMRVRRAGRDCPDCISWHRHVPGWPVLSEDKSLIFPLVKLLSGPSQDNIQVDFPSFRKEKQKVELSFTCCFSSELNVFLLMYFIFLIIIPQFLCYVSLSPVPQQIPNFLFWIIFSEILFSHINKSI